MNQSEERKIIWQKWINPLTGAGEEDAIEEADEQDLNGNDYLAEENRQYSQQQFKPKLGKCLVGPFGIIPINEHSDAAVVYDFWIAHFNFAITPEVEQVASTVPGVETWDTFTRYRARVGFGKGFTRSKVMENIQKALGVGPTASKSLLSTNKKIITIETLKGHLSSRYKTWAIFVKKDGQFDLIHGEEQFVRDTVANREPDSFTQCITSWKNETSK